MDKKKVRIFVLIVIFILVLLMVYSFINLNTFYKKAINNILAGNKFARGSALVDKNTRQELYKAAYDKLKNFKTEEYRHQAKG